MELIEKNVTLRELRASEGLFITDKATKTMKAEVLYLGKEDSQDNYIEVEESEINIDTPDVQEQ